MKIAITGGSGFIGTNLIEFLIKINCSILNLDISPPKISSHKIYWKCVDIRDYNLLYSELSQFIPDYLINLAADLGMNNAPIELFNTNTVGVKNIVNVANELPSILRVIYASSLLVCKNGYIPNSFDDYCPPNTYGKSKMMGELIVKNFSSNNKWIIVRPTSVWGPWFQYSYRKFFKAIKFHYYFQPGSVSPFKPICYVGNAAYMIFKILISDKDLSNYNFLYLADYPPTTTKDWSDSIRKSFGYNGSAFTLPVFLLKVPAFIGDLLIYFGIKDPIFSTFRLKNMLSGAVYPTADLEAIVGPLPHSLNDAVSKTVEWMRQEGDF